MTEKLKHMTYAELPHTYDAYEHLLAKFHEKDSLLYNPDIFPGLGSGKRSDAVQASLFDAIHAEILGEREERKELVRNRRVNNRKHPENKTVRNKNRKMRITRLHGEMWEDRIVAESGWKGMPGVFALSVWIRDERNGSKQDVTKEAEIIRNLREKSAEKVLREDFNVELHQHEERMAEYREHMYWYDRFVSDAESYMDEEIDGQFCTPEQVMNAVNGFRILAEDEKKYAQEILKGECY